MLNNNYKIFFSKVMNAEKATKSKTLLRFLLHSISEDKESFGGRRLDKIK